MAKNIRKKMTILVADDDDSVREVCKEAIENAGYNVFTASDGIEAFEMLAQRDFSLVVADVNMPRLDGIGLYLSVLKKYPAMKDRFLFMSGGLFVDKEAEDVLAVMEKRFLKKPFNVSELLRSISAIIPASKQEAPADKRHARRFSIGRECLLSFDGTAPLACHTLDISGGGIKISYSGEALKPLTEVRIEIRSAGTASTGHVAWSRAGRNGEMFSGIEFSEMIPEGVIESLIYRG